MYISCDTDIEVRERVRVLQGIDEPMVSGHERSRDKQDAWTNSGALTHGLFIG
jgi:hypothetical protein